jgi:hypothetical protein
VNRQVPIQPGAPRLTVPAAGDTVHAEAVTDPVALLGSVESLLLTNQTAATQWLGRQLALLNRSPLPRALREALVSVIQTPLSSMCERAQVLSAALGPMALLERGEFFESFATLATEHAHAWKGLVLDHFTATPPAPVPPELIVQTLRALELEAVVAFALYRSLPRRTWQEAGEVYRLADVQGSVETTASVLGDQGDRIEQSARDCLVRFLLIHLLLPQRLPRGGVWLAHRYLERYAGLCPFLPQREDTPGEFVLSVDVGGSTPRAIAPDQLDQPLPPDTRHLRLTDLFARIRQEYAELEHHRLPPPFGDVPLELMRQVLRGMLLAWYLRPPRQAKRERVSGWLNAVVGFESVARLLGGGGAEHVRCFQIDQSSNGVALEFHTSWPADLQVGQILLLQRKDSDLLAMPERFVAVVRRFVLRSGEVLMAGTERLPGRPVAVQVRDQDARAATHPALLLRRSGNARMTLVVPPGTFREHAEYAIQDAEGDFVALADKLLESTEFFERIEMSPAQQLATAPGRARRADGRGLA